MLAQQHDIYREQFNTASRLRLALTHQSIITVPKCVQYFVVIALMCDESIFVR